MSTAQRLKLAFIGSHGVGKTTLCYGLAARLKARDVSLEVVHEVARRCPLPINEETGVDSQAWILHNQIAEELVAQHRYPVVLCDRSVLDNYVYLLCAAGNQDGLDPLVRHWVGTYDLLFHVPIIQAPDADGVRATDPAFQHMVDARLHQEIELHELEVVRLNPEDRGSWLDVIEARTWEHLSPAQLELA